MSIFPILTLFGDKNFVNRKLYCEDFREDQYRNFFSRKTYEFVKSRLSIDVIYPQCVTNASYAYILLCFRGGFFHLR